jgi:hypothetical protein
VSCGSHRQRSRQMVGELLPKASEKSRNADSFAPPARVGGHEKLTADGQISDR